MAKQLYGDISAVVFKYGRCCQMKSDRVVKQPGIRKAVCHARMAHKATKWPILKILTGPVMRPDRTKLVKYKLFCEKDFNL